MRIGFFVLLVFGVLATSFLFVHDQFDAWLGSDRALVWLELQGPWAGPIGASLIASDVILPVPASGIMAALGSIYGGFLGGCYDAIGSVSAGFLAYGSTRLLGPSAARFIAGEAELVRLSAFFDEAGPWAIALTRVLPVVPEILCCLAGLAPMPLPRFSFALLCGSIPLAFLVAVFGSLGREYPTLTILLAIAIPMVLLLPLWWITRRNSKCSNARSEHLRPRTATLDDSS